MEHAATHSSRALRALFLIGAVALLAFGVSLFRLSQGDVLNDEALLGFRSIGYLDFLDSEDQTTPLEWFSPTPPWWARVWFHDHPPVVFILQHLSSRLFGPTAVGLRFPSALAAAVAVFIFGLTAKALWGDRAGVFAAVSFLVLAGRVSMARVGMQESILLVWLLLSFYAAVRAVQEVARPRTAVRWWYVACAAWGIAMLTKYTAVAFLPAFVWMLWRSRARIPRRHALALGITALGFLLPVVWYQGLLFRAVGHFDYQFSAFFGQTVAAWQERPGREFYPTLALRATALIPNVARHASFPLAITTGICVAVGLVRVMRKRAGMFEAALIVLIASFVVMFLVAGPLYWFTYLLWPWMMILSIGIGRNFYLSAGVWRRRAMMGACAVLFAVEAAVAANTVYARNPYGREWLTYLPLWRNHAQWGYQKLEGAVAQRLDGFYPSATFPMRYPFLDVLRQQSLELAKSRGKKSAFVLMVYDTTMHQHPTLWTFLRRATYDGWPIIDVDTYRDALAREGANVFWDQGFEKIIFVRADEASHILLRGKEAQSEGGRLWEEELQQAGIVPNEVILSPKTGEPVFRIYDLVNNSAIKI